MLSNEIIFFGSFVIFIVAVLLLDLLFIGKKEHIISAKEAGIWSIVWIALALVFFFFLKWHGGQLVHGIDSYEHLYEVVNRYAAHIQIDPNNLEHGIQQYNNYMALAYITGYLVEKTLSVDNLFVIMMILTAFSVRLEHYKPVLFWGILGAIVFRAIFIFAGAALVQKFDWLLIVFGVFLVYTAVKMYLDRNKEEKIEPQNHPLVKYLSRHLPVFPRYVGKAFFIRQKNKLFITPLFLVLAFIEFSDVVFAFDSIPAIFSITLDPYVVFFSNIFAILGLRALFFLLIKIVHKFHYLKTGVAILLFYIGLKLIFHHYLDEIGFQTIHSLLIILVVLTGSIVLSLVFPKKETQTEIHF